MKKISFSFFFFVILPVVIVGVYYLYFSSAQYLVETKYIIQGRSKSQADMLGALAGFAGISASSSAKDSYIAQEYIWSAELLNKLDKAIKIKEHYSDDHYDWWARLPKDAPFSDFLNYWQDSVEIEFDSTSGITTLRVTAFTADKAVEISEKIIKEAENHINKLFERLRSDSLKFAKNELKDAEKRLIQARTNITTFRNRQKDINPERTTVARLELVTSLESKLKEAQAELNNVVAFMKPTAFKVRALKNKVATLQSQIASERKKWGDVNDSSHTLSTKVASYEELLAKKMVAERLYESSLSSLESARLGAIQQQQYLEVITSPYKPSEAEKPYVFKNMVSVILGSFLFWVIGNLIVSAVRDHV